MSIRMRHFTTLIVATMLVRGVSAAECALPCNECGCFYALTQDLQNAKYFQEQFSCEAAHLRAKYPGDLTPGQVGASREDFKNFVAELKTYPVKLPACVEGPEDQTADYSPWDYRVETLASASPPPVAQQCRRSPGAQLQLKQAMQNSKCPGMAQAIQAHEDYHQQQCEAAGGTLSYNHKSGAEEAGEEVAAYGKQIAELNTRVAQAGGHFDPMKCIVMGHDGMFRKGQSCTPPSLLPPQSSPSAGPCSNEAPQGNSPTMQQN